MHTLRVSLRAIKIPNEALVRQLLIDFLDCQYFLLTGFREDAIIIVILGSRYGGIAAGGLLLYPPALFSCNAFTLSYANLSGEDDFAMRATGFIDGLSLSRQQNK